MGTAGAGAPLPPADEAHEPPRFFAESRRYTLNELDFANEGNVITRCPVAEFFAEHDASELSVRTWCELDFPLAKKWGGRLERTGTIAMGAQRCDFRWHVDKK